MYRLFQWETCENLPTLTIIAVKSLMAGPETETASAKEFADAEPFIGNQVTVNWLPCSRQNRRLVSKVFETRLVEGPIDGPTVSNPADRHGASPTISDHQLFGLKYHHHLSVRVRNIRFHCPSSHRNVASRHPSGTCGYG